MPGTTTYIKAFAALTHTIVIHGTDHRFDTADLAVRVLTYWPNSYAHHPSKFTPQVLGGWHVIDPTSYDVTAHLTLNKYPGLVAVWPTAETPTVCYMEVPSWLVDHAIASAQTTARALRPERS